MIHKKDVTNSEKFLKTKSKAYHIARKGSSLNAKKIKPKKILHNLPQFISYQKKNY